MTTNPTPIPEPTAPTAVVVGKRNGVTVIAARMDFDNRPWVMQNGEGYYHWRSWSGLCRELTDIRVVPVAEVAAQIDQLKARIAELEVDKPTPGPWLRGDELKAVLPTLKAGEPGADIPDEAVEAAWREFRSPDRASMRAAIAAADAKRAELEGQA